MSRTRISTAREAIFECIEFTGSADLGGEDFEHISEHLARWAFDPTTPHAHLRRLTCTALACQRISTGIAWQAEVTFDGEPWARVEHRGNGGCLIWRKHPDVTVADYRERLNCAKAWAVEALGETFEALDSLASSTERGETFATGAARYLAAR